MKNLAGAVVDAMAFLELSGNDVVDPDAAVSALEMLTHRLERATADEIAALREEVQARLRQLQAGPSSKAEHDFLQDFFVNAGLE